MSKNETFLENNNSNSRIPKLRFPGFSGEWKEKSLGDVGTFVRGLSYNKSEVTEDASSVLVVRSNNIIQDGVVDCKNGLQYVNKAPSAEQILQKGDVVICLANGSSNLVGKTASFDGNYEGVATVGAFCGIYRSMSPITKYLVQTSLYKEKISLIKQGGNGALSNLYGKDILGLCFYFPPTLAEQQKIASYLSELDNLIFAQDQKADALKEKKKGLMQQLFPQPGETIPRLRFPGFKGEWEFINGNVLFKPISNKNHNSDLPILALTQDQGAVPREMINYKVFVSDKSVAGYKVVEVDDFIISLRSFQGGIEYSRYKGLCSPAYIVLRKKSKELCSDFYRIYFKSFSYIQELNKNLEGIRDGKMISYSQFSEIKLPKPSPAEQQRIAECISTLEDAIAAEADKLEALKNHKKGLMQQLFPQPTK